MPNSTTTSPPWQELPDLPLFTILQNLLSFVNISSFSSVCRSWLSLALSSSSLLPLSSRPPLLLRPSPSSFSLHPLNSPFHHLTTPLPFHPKDRPNCLGFSHGYTILTSNRLCLPFLVNVITGRDIHLPQLPKNPLSYYHAALTASPDDPDCRVLTFSTDAVFCCRLGDPERHWRNESFYYFGEFIRRVISFKGKILVMNSHARLFYMELDPAIRVTELHVKGLHSMEFIKGHFGPQLVECEGDLLLVLFAKEDGPVVGNDASVKVYRLDSAAMEWVELDGLGDYCVFIDCKGKSPVACSRPGVWGGRGNCVCLTGPECEGWWEYSLEKKTWSKMSLRGEKLSTSSFAPSFLTTAKHSPCWPSPIWVYPSQFYGLDKSRSLEL